MSVALSLDSSGSLLIPADVINSAHWPKEAPIEVSVTPEGLLIRSASSQSEGRLVRDEYGHLVIESDFPISDEDVIRAIAADRK